MRILLTSVGRPRIDSANGVELEIYRISETLASMGHDVLLTCITHREASPIPGVDVRAFLPSAVPFGIPKKLPETILSWKPDVAVISSVYIPFNTRFSAWFRANEIPYVIRPCGGFGALNERVHTWKKRPYKVLFELPMLDHASFIWAAGDEEDIRQYGTRARIVPTPRGFDLPRLASTARSEVEVLKGLEDKFIFGFVGRLDPVHKGLDLALEAFQMLNDEKAAFVLVGPTDSEGAERLKGMISDDTRSERIRIVGPLFMDDRDRFLASIDAFVHTSRWEGGIPNSVIEAAIMAKPLLLTGQADPADLLHTSGGCIRVQLDVESITKGMRKLKALSGSERAKMGARAAEAIASNFGWDKMVQGFLKGLSEHGVD